MKVIQTALPGVLIIEPKVFGDARGFFMETYQAQRYQEAGIATDFIQDNYSRSSQAVLRGLHYQLKYPQAKLVSVARGEVFDVAVDIRVGSPTFGQWVGVNLSEENYRQLYIPRGFAHGFCVLSETADFVYKCDGFYRPDDEKGLIWNDPEVGVDWPIKFPALSEKDKANLSLAALKQHKFLPDYQEVL
ncbi:MAG: dTDP-4-dehydrorhamnose 3,5-epimerase [Gammaproteobacteria bacterium]|nr:dTDP-4-dehydrorhamnose 3,5-epimerase [Gammaproteobacteria bacterium]MDH5801235.1 dTDP-4-dehydrorhamnose 3,5-epimerase [Gammaproteobacteria bacterium]